MAFKLIEAQGAPEDQAPAERAESLIPGMGTQDLKDLGRHGARTASNLITRGVGTTGDILGLINDYIVQPSKEKITGYEQTPYEETELGKFIAPTETLRKSSEKLFGETVKPQNKLEKFTDDVVEDAALLFASGPSKLAAKGVAKTAPIVKTIGKAIGANLLGEGAERASGSKGAGALTKAGALIALSILDKPAAAKQVGQMYQKADALLPAEATTKASGLLKKSEALKNSVTKGRPLANLSPSESFVVKQIDKVQDLVKDGKVNVSQLVAQKRSLGEELSSLWQQVPGKKDQKGVRNMAKQLTGYMKNTLEDFGSQNKQWYDLYSGADQAYGTLARSEFFKNAIKSRTSGGPLSSGVAHLLGIGTGAAGGAIGAATGAALGKGSAMATGAAGALGTAGYQSAKLLYQINKSPVLRKIYGETLKAMANENVAAFNKYAQQLDKGLQKEESKSKYRIIKKD